MSKIGYKATKNFKCLDQLYVVGKKYKMRSKPIVCVRGYHYCLKADNVLNYYSYDSSFKLLEIEDLSEETNLSYDKSCTNHIRIIREITDAKELLDLLGIYRTFNANGTESYSKAITATGYSESFFDSNGKLKNKTFTYDDCHRGYVWEKCTYDKRRNEIKVERSNGYLLERKYDKKNRIIEEKHSDGNFAYIEYDKNGGVLNRRANFGSQVKTTFSRNGNKIKTFKDNGYFEKTIVNSFGAEIYHQFKEGDCNNVTISTFYPSKKLKKIVTKSFRNGTLDSYEEQTYNENGNLLLDKNMNGNVGKYFYDKKNKLVKSVITTVH